MFYDNFSTNDIPKPFSLEHLLFIISFIAISIIGYYLSKKIKKKNAKKVLLVIAIIASLMEIIKIGLRIYKQYGFDSYLPLYYCSLFLYAMWFIFIKNKRIERIGYTFLVFGGIFASIAFSLYPATSLFILPIWHPATIHSFIYHSLMFFSGLLVINSGLYVPKIKDSLLYTGYLTICCIIAVIVNYFLGTNMMFLSYTFELPIISDIAANSKYLYMFIVYIAESILMFWISYSIYKLIKHLHK